MSQSAKPKLGFEVTEQSAVPRAKPKLGFEVMETEVSRDLRGGGGDSNFTNTGVTFIYQNYDEFYICIYIMNIYYIL